MGLAAYLKKLLTGYIDVYSRFFLKTFGVAITLTLLCFVLILVLLKYNPPVSQKQVSVLSYLYFRYSREGVYALVDLSKTVYLFFIALMSVALLRLDRQEDAKVPFFTLGTIFDRIKWKDIVLLITVLILASVIDYSILWIGSISNDSGINANLKHYIFTNLFFIRIYAPLFLFSIAIYMAYSGGFPRLGFSKFLLLIISLWLFNEFSYEGLLFTRNHIINLFLIPFSEDKAYMIESIFGLFLMSAYAVGFYAAMTLPLKIFDEADNTPAANQQS